MHNKQILLVIFNLFIIHIRFTAKPKEITVSDRSTTKKIFN